MARSFPPWDPDGTLEAIRVQRMMEMDIATGLKAKELWEKTRYWYKVRAMGISGLVMSLTHRRYFVEYFDRLVHNGPESFPSSFRIGHRFLRYDKKYFVFDNREEVEHLLTTDDYFAWYAKSDMPKNPAVLETAMRDGVVYSYNMTNEYTGHRLQTADSELVIAGVSFVRHGHELSCMLLAGENPPYPSDKDAAASMEEVGEVPGKEWLRPAPELSTKDRYLEGMSNHARVILITRFDLVGQTYDARYLFRDVGQGYLQASDDPIEHEIMRQLCPKKDMADYLQRMQNELARYEVLYSALAALIYLPLTFITEIDRVQETRFGTELLAQQDEESTKEAIKVLGDEARRFYCTVKCLTSNGPISATEQRVLSCLSRNWNSPSQALA
jgi:hypothetical protein